MVEILRGALVESAHCGVAAVANARGEIVEGWGDTSLVTYPRSALKPVQAIALAETGALDAFRLGPRHLALACGSHRGEPFHRAMVREWLAGLALSESALACGPEAPMDPAAAAQVLRDGTPQARAYHNCSGKHCGFLSVSKHARWPLEGYSSIDHPAQQRFLDTLSDVGGTDARRLPLGVDGCTLPAAAMSVGAFATAMARFADNRVFSPARTTAIAAIHDAMRAHPEYVAGTDEPGVHIARVTQGRIIAKTGAEGFLCAFLPGAGLGVALKIADGATRARVPALLAVLSAAKLLDAAELRALAALAEPPVRDSTGAVVGQLRPCNLTSRNTAG